MGPIGHCSVGLAAKPLTPKVPLGVLLLATWLLDVLAIGFGFAGIERGGMSGLPWSHGLFMSVIWSVLAALLTARIYRDHRAGVVVGFLVFSHWALDFVSHPIPFSSFSWRSWQWSYGHPLPSDLPLLFGGSPKMGLGLYNSISAVEATTLEFGMFVLGAAVYATYVFKKIKAKRSPPAGIRDEQMRNLTVLLLIFSLNMWPQQPKVQPSNPEPGGQIRQEFLGGYNAADVEAVVALYADDATLVSDGGTFRGRDEIRKWVKSGLDQGSKLEIESSVERSSGTLCYGAGRTRRLVGSVIHLGQYLIVMEKIGGEWRIVQHFSLNAAATPAANLNR